MTTKISNLLIKLYEMIADLKDQLKKAHADIIYRNQLIDKLQRELIDERKQKEIDKNKNPYDDKPWHEGWGEIKGPRHPWQRQGDYDPYKMYRTKEEYNKLITSDDQYDQYKTTIDELKYEIDKMNREIGK